MREGSILILKHTPSLLCLLLLFMIALYRSYFHHLCVAMDKKKSLAVGIVHRLVAHQKRHHVRLPYAWPSLWMGVCLRINMLPSLIAYFLL